MNAENHLTAVAKALNQRRLEAVLIGNAAAALQGAPVTTVDFDFFFRATPANLRKLKLVARDLNGHLFRPYYPVSGLYRLMNDDSGLQVDFMAVVHGVRSFAGVRSRAARLSFGGWFLRVAALEDIIKSKRAAGRAKDRAVLEILDETSKAKATGKPSSNKGA